MGSDSTDERGDSMHYVVVPAIILYGVESAGGAGGLG